MAPTRKRENRENRENQFYDVGVQGRKTGITLEDKGVRDEHGLEPISGIFSSPQKSPPKRVASSGRNATSDSASMDIQESSVPSLATTSANLLRNSRTHFPPPKARSPMKTTLGSSPRRQSSMGPRAPSANPPSSPTRAVSHPAVNRLLDFEQDEASLQETPALSGSGQPRGKRNSIYDIETSPSRANSVMLEEEIQEEIAEESYVADVGNDSLSVAGDDVSEEVEESPVIPEKPQNRGKKRKSSVEPPDEEEAPKARRGRPASSQVSASQKKGKKAAPAPASQPRRSKRVSDVTEEEPSIALDVSAGATEDTDTPPVAPKRRGRPPSHTEQKANNEPVFKKPKAMDKSKKKADPPATEKNKKEKKKEPVQAIEAGKFVDVHRKPISRADMDQMSTTSAGSRFGRGRHLSVFRELEPEAVARVGRTGRHRVAPVDFWRNESITYDKQMGMQAIVKNEFQEPVPRKYPASKAKGKRRNVAESEEEDMELEPWEENEGVFQGIHRDYDAVTGVATDLVESRIAWAKKGVDVDLTDVGDASFKFVKLSSVGDESFLSWGFIELQDDQMKRTKNSRRMHMVFHVQSGAVEFKIHENVFILHRGGVCQVPRDEYVVIANVSSAATPCNCPHAVRDPAVGPNVGLVLLARLKRSNANTPHTSYSVAYSLQRCSDTATTYRFDATVHAFSRGTRLLPLPYFIVPLMLADKRHCLHVQLRSEYEPANTSAGNTYSIKNVGTGTSRIFFAQGCESTIAVEE
ncbi:hypothetical protein P280DRAFT_507384 [Massarina eburnea CBS 473.64]|uniref:Mif2/CENP-C cupin domain-containing protein n=1 Tax=Massarina eburnea CBS 473.64 TaxID=1395130 RepID=A0A6A6S0A6_9PLEO|nr:hypothetical protein P280DRAFT_507384 [Massarina eburnea CBS 473.64]